MILGEASGETEKILVIQKGLPVKQMEMQKAVI